MKLIERIEQMYEEVDTQLMECANTFELVTDQGATIKNLTLNKVYVAGSEKLQTIIDELVSIKQKLEQIEMMEDVQQNLED